jgi:hypothetical protein
MCYLALIGSNRDRVLYGHVSLLPARERLILGIDKPLISLIRRNGRK